MITLQTSHVYRLAPFGNSHRHVPASKICYYHRECVLYISEYTVHICVCLCLNSASSLGDGSECLYSASVASANPAWRRARCFYAGHGDRGGEGSLAVTGQARCLVSGVEGLVKRNEWGGGRACYGLEQIDVTLFKSGGRTRQRTCGSWNMNVQHRNNSWPGFVQCSPLWNRTDGYRRDHLFMSGRKRACQTTGMTLKLNNTYADVKNGSRANYKFGKFSWEYFIIFQNIEIACNETSKYSIFSRSAAASSITSI